MHSLHHGQHELLGHVQRVADSVPVRCGPVAWLHHAGDGHSARDLSAAGLTPPEMEAIELLADTDPLSNGPADLERARALTQAPGSAGRIARVVARAALIDLLRTGHSLGDHFAALTLLDESRYAR
jgi:hypothetical protein